MHLYRFFLFFIIISVRRPFTNQSGSDPCPGFTACTFKYRTEYFMTKAITITGYEIFCFFLLGTCK